MIKVQQSLIKVSSRTYWNILKSFVAKFTPRKKIRNIYLSQNSSPKIETGFFPRPGAIVTFFIINYRWNF